MKFADMAAIDDSEILRFEFLGYLRKDMNFFAESL